ncbi:hypothetical protein KKA14_06140, partial [bacterium]|nr:hypothetical protein [bacterium]
KGYKHNGTYQAVSGYVNVHSKYIQVKKAYTPLLKVVKTCDVELNKGDLFYCSFEDICRLNAGGSHQQFIKKNSLFNFYW